MKRIIAALAMIAVFTGTVYAVSSYQKTINVEYGVSLSINGQTPTLTDVNGKTVQPFVYDGTTYVPIRAVGEGLGATVGYDEASNTASVTNDSLVAMSNIHSVSELSHDMHDEIMSMQVFFDTEPISDGTAESFKKQYDYISEWVNKSTEAIEFEEKYRSASFINARKALAQQHISYQKAYTAFFNFKAGKVDKDNTFPDAFEEEYKSYFDVKQKCYTAITELSHTSK